MVLRFCSPIPKTDAPPRSCRRRRAALLLAIYAAWLRGTWRDKLSLRSWGPRWLARWLALPLPWLGAALGVSAETRLDGVTANALATIGPCVVTLSPHGMGFGHTLLTGPALMKPPLASLQPLGVAASAVFAVPLWRELLLLMGWREASPGLAERMLRAGRSVVVLPGGIREMVETTPTQDALRCHPNLGFVRLALQCGRPLLPVYAFGETQLFRSPDTMLRARRMAAHRWGVGLPLATGRFGLPFPLAPPLPTKHRLVVGQPLLSGSPCAAAPSKEAVLELYGRWCAELLRRLFTAHAHEVLPKAVAARGRARLDCSADCEGHFRAGTQRAASAGRFGPQTGSVEASWADKPSISTYMCMCMCMCMCISLHAKSSTKIRFSTLLPRVLNR